jgi:alpha-tubulin suppressor-like RCC1 family protein
VALRRDGTVWAWGSNNVGQLGTGGREAESLVSVRVAELRDVVAIGAFETRSFAVTADGRVHGWGDRLWLQGSKWARSRVPMQVPGVSGAVEVRAGAPNLARLRDGSVMAWGAGWLGDGSPRQHEHASERVPQPVRVPGISDAIAVRAGADHAAAVLRDGSVLVWGSTRYGSLGTGSVAERGVGAEPLPVRLPVTGVVDIAYAAGAAVAMAKGGVLTWGDARLGATGRPGIERRATPTPLPAPTGIVRVWARAYSTVALAGDGRIWVWGASNLDQ